MTISLRLSPKKGFVSERLSDFGGPYNLLLRSSDASSQESCDLQCGSGSEQLAVLQQANFKYFM